MRRTVILLALALAACGGSESTDAGTPAGDSGGGGMCEDISSTYLVDLTGDCSGGDGTVVVERTVGGGACDFTFTSTPVKAMPSVNGMVTVNADGGFSSMMLTLGTGSPVSCDGVYDGSTLTLTCGTCSLELFLS